MFDIRLLGKRNEPFDSWIWIVVLGQITFLQWNKDILYNGEFDPGSG